MTIKAPKRPAGRPRVNGERITFSVTLFSHAQKMLLIQMGGSRWLRAQLDGIRRATALAPLPARGKP